MIHKRYQHPQTGFGDTDGSKWQDNKLKYEPDTHYNLENQLKQKIINSHDRKFKLGLEIILILISHPKKDVRAFSLGRLYSLTEDESAQKLIIRDLREMYNEPQSETHKAAEESLNFVCDEIHSLMIIEMIIRVLVQLENQTKVKLNHLKATPLPHFHHPHFFNSKNKFLFRFTRILRQLSLVLDKTIFSSELEELIPELEDVENLFMGNYPEDGIIPYSKISNFQWRPTDSIEELAKIYSHTFLEKRHLDRLQTYLDDEDYHIRHIGASALISVADCLLHSSRDEVYSLNDLHFENSSQKFAKI